MDNEQMIAELEGGEPQTEASDQTPAAPETPGFDYYLGDKANRIPESAEFSFKHNGQLARVPATKLVNNYRQTAHLEAKLKDLNDKYSTYEKEVGDLDSWRKQRDEFSKYDSLQKWSTENPDAWNRIWEGYQKAQNGIMPQDQAQTSGIEAEALNRTISELRNQVGELSSWKQERDAKDQEAALQGEIEKIESEATEYAKKVGKYGIELDAPDEEGISLKGRILKFAADNGIGKFSIAADTYLNDTLLEKATQMGRQEGVKGVKGDVAAGIVSRSGIPPQGQDQKVDVSRMSEDERRNAALQELTSDVT